ncbi:MAG: DUF2505 domain-containing protein [Nocardioides sp.]
MRLEHHATYPASPAEVYALFGDVSLREEISRRQGALRTTVGASDGWAEGAGRMTVAQVLPTDQLPELARKFVGAEITLERIENWQAGTTAQLDITIPGQPGSMAATLALAEHASGSGREGTSVSIDGEVTVSIPFVGGKIEAAVAGVLRKALEIESEVICAHL